MDLRTDRLKLREIVSSDALRHYAQRLHRKADDLELVRKNIPVDPADVEIKEGERAAIRYVSTPRLDRDNEILLPDGAILDDFRASPTVLWAHKYDQPPIGKDLWIKVTPKGILVKTQYATTAFADDIYELVKGGFLNTSSVGFIPVEAMGPMDDGFPALASRLKEFYGVPEAEVYRVDRVYTKWILLEHSDVPVPSNAHSLNIAVGKGAVRINSESLRKDLEVEEPIPAPPTALDGPDAYPGLTEVRISWKKADGSIVETPMVPEAVADVQRAAGVSEEAAAAALPLGPAPEAPEERARASEPADPDPARPEAKAPVADPLEAILARISKVEKKVDSHIPDPGKPLPVPDSMKVADAEKNPSIDDIRSALYRALNPDPNPDMSIFDFMSSPYRFVIDLYPTKFPSGHCTFGESVPGENLCRIYRQDYIYKDDVATMKGAASEVVMTWVDKSADASTKVPPELVNIVPLEMSAVAALPVAEAIEIVEPPLPEPIEIVEPAVAPVGEPAPRIAPPAFDAAALEAAVSRALSRLDLAKVIPALVKKELDRMRGRVL